MGWNGSGQKGTTPVQPKVAVKKPSPIRGLIAGIVVAALAVVAYFVFFLDGEKPQTDKKEKTVARIKEVKPAPAPKRATTPDATTVERPVDETPKPTYTGRSPTDATPPATIKRGPLQRYQEGLKNGKRLFENSFDQWLANYAVPGQLVPPFPSEAMPKEAFMKSVADKIVINDDDSPEDRAIKESVSAMREELKKWIKEGGTFEDYIKKIQERQDREAYFVSEANRMLSDDFEQNQDVEGSIALWRKLNEKLVADGLRKAELPSEVRHALKRNKMEIPQE